MLIHHHDQQIVLQKAWNPVLCLETNVGTNQTKFENNLTSRAILLGFLRYLVSIIRYEANKSNRRREERPMGSRAVKMLRDLRRHARGLAQHVVNVRAEVRAGMHNCQWLIWYDDRRAQ